MSAEKKSSGIRKPGRGFFRHISTRLLVSYLLILVLPVSLFGAGMVHHLSSLYLEDEQRVALDAAGTLAESMKYTFSGIRSTLNSFCSNNEIWGYFTRHYQYPENSISEYYTLVRPTMDTYKALHAEMLSMTMYTQNRTIVTNHSEIRQMDDVPEMRALMQEMMDREVFWTVTVRKVDSAERLLASQVFRSYGRPRGLFCVELDRSKLQKLLGDGDDEVHWCVVNPYGEVLLSSPEGPETEKIWAVPVSEGLPEEEPSVRRMEDGQHSVFSVPFRLPDNGETWYILEYTESGRLVSANIRVFVLVLALLIILMAILSFVFAHYLGKRLHQVSRGIAQIEQGDFSVRINIRGEDEVTDLGNALNHMTEQLDRLMAENTDLAVRQTQLEVATREASLNALQSQINPHFLYNSLEAIRNGIDQGDPETGQVVTLLARSMRRLAAWEGPTVMLQEELQCVEEYLQIQRFRFGDRLKSEICIDPGMEKMRVPKLILEPLVENAVAHGIARKKDGGTIWISGWREDGRTVFSVKNDGEPMDELEQENLRQILNTPGFHGKNIGLKNVYERVRLYYGDRASLTWESTQVLTEFRLTILGSGEEVLADAGADRG